MDSMARLNRIGARLMHKYNAHGSTDITGFGLLGHAQALARTKKMKSLSSSTICQSLPKWQLWLKPVAICSNFCKDTPQKHLVDSSSAFPGNKLQLTAKTSKSKKDTKPGLSESWKKDNAPRVSLTNLELLKFLLRKRKASSGKPEVWILKEKNPPETDVKNSSRFDFPEENKTNSNLF